MDDIFLGWMHTMSDRLEMEVEGTVYAAAAAVNLTGNGGGNGKPDIVGGAYVCKSMLVSGGGNINVDLNGNGPLLPEIALVE